MSEQNLIHSKAGKLGAGATSVETARARARAAFTSGAPNGVVLHFHGGLVAQKAAESTAAFLVPAYLEADTHPLFFVWESGLLETIRNNLGDILQDKVFRELVKKVSEWVLKKGDGAVVVRGGGVTLINEEQLREDYDKWFDGALAAPPMVKDAPGDRLRGVEIDQDELARQIEAGIEGDPGFAAALSGLALAAGRAAQDLQRGAGVVPAVVAVRVDREALDALVPPPGPDQLKGLFSWIGAARFVAKVVMASLQRFREGSDHGAYTTLVEEVLRAAYLSKVGEEIWRQMKQDAEVDAFNADNAVGDTVLSEWKHCLEEGLVAPRITLVGHSTGAVFINGWLKRSSGVLPALAYDVVLLAPACRIERFAQTLAQYGSVIRHFRMFCMRDEVERADQLVKIIYPRSLLYFVSGVVEGGVDVALLGMQRFHNDASRFTDDAMQALRTWLAPQGHTIWSVVAEGGAGLSSTSERHQDFDNDPGTIASLQYLLRHGF